MTTEAPTAEPVRIIELKVQNVKRIVCVHVKPDGSLVQISGKNGQGKTSVLDSIAMAFGGKGAIPPEALRRGAKEGEILVDCGSFMVRRTFTDDGETALRVTDRDGLSMSGPQTFLDSIVGKIAFDPIAFAKMEAKAQAEQLRKLAGLDFSKADREIEKLREQRKLVNRDYETARSKLRTMPAPESGLPESPLVVADLMTERDARHRTINGNATKRRNLQDLQNYLSGLDEEIRKAELALSQMKATRERKGQELTAMEASVAALVDPDLGEIDAKLRDSQGINEKIRQRDEYNRADAEVKKHGDASDQLTAAIKEMEQAKADKIAAAKFPIDGLGFDAEGMVTLNGLPLSQASQAERLKVSMAIGIAANPTLRTVLIRDGNDLDSDNRALVAQMAEESGVQVWLETVSDGDGEGIIIEDGQVKATAPKREQLQEA